jgi:hypothetical protein
MNEIVICNIDTEKFNPFGASPEELISIALDEAGLNQAETTINKVSSRELCKFFYDKRDNYRELTKLGNILMKNSVISPQDLQSALEYQKLNPELKLGNAFLKLNLCSLEDIEASLDIQNQIREDMEELELFRRRIVNIKNRLRTYI